MVVGSHPHWVQGIEEHRGRPIVCSLGNFVFDQDWSAKTKQRLIMHLVFQGPQLAALRLVPVVIENFYQPRIATGEEMAVILDRVWCSTDLLLAAPYREISRRATSHNRRIYRVRCRQASARASSMSQASQRGIDSSAALAAVTYPSAISTASSSAPDSRITAVAFV